jgi:hypothetical protein
MELLLPRLASIGAGHGDDYFSGGNYPHQV